MKRTAVVLLSVVAMVVFWGTPAAVEAQEGGGPTDPWTLLAAVPEPGAPGPRSYIQPDAYQALALDQAALVSQLGAVPAEPSPGARPAGGGQVVSLPSPTGGFERFAVVESPIMDPALAAQFPDIRTYSGQGIDDPAATLRFDVSDRGFHAQVLSPSGAWYIDPYYHLDTSAYISYFKADLTANPHDDFTEEVLGGGLSDAGGPPAANRSGTQLRIHRAAFTASGEYTAFHGGTVAGAQAAIVTMLNRLNGIYEREVAVRMVLVANNSVLTYTNAATDPFANSCSDTSANQTVTDTAIGSANYDIGHVLTTGSGGCAQLRSVGVNGSKARGTTGTSSPVNDPFTVDYVAHEVGHQYGGNHTFNGSLGSCSGGNRNASTAYEPGSGSTIQAYAGICGLDDLQLVGTGATGASDPYFHSLSFDEIVSHTTGGNPGDRGATSTGNAVPTAAAGPDGAIPASTPFLLEGAGTDANGDTLTYGWEQRDLGAQRALGNPQITAGPLFRSFVPTTSPVRYLPRLSTIAAGGTNVPGPCPALTTTMGAAQACWSEYLPTAARSMNFRVSVRDNRAGGGGVNTDDLAVTVTNTGAAFAVTSQATPVTLAAGVPHAVTWNVAGTTAAPISAPKVSILLSTDGGLTFPITLLANTPNDGSQAVSFPSGPTSTARIMVVEAGTGPGVRFFNVNKANITITGTAGTLSGTVRTAGGQPIAGALVQVPGHPAGTSDANGVYAVPGFVATGSYTVTTEGVCRAVVTNPVTIGGNTTLDVTMGGYGSLCSVDAAAWDTTTTPLALTGDNASVPISLPFPYPHRGVTYGNAHVSTNGVVNFLAPDTTSANTSIPAAAAPNAAIYGFWDDINVDGSASVLANTFGTAPNRRFVIEWRNVTLVTDPTLRFSFQVVLYEGASQRVRLQYKDIDPGTAASGTGATVGQENAAGNDAAQVSLNQGLLFDGLSVRPK